MMEGLLRLAGLSLIVLALAHLPIARHLRWKEELVRVSLLTRQIFTVHCLFLCLTLVLMGLLCLVWPETLLQSSPLGRLVAGGLCFFWFCRLFAQWFVYDWRHWRGKRFETVVHLMFTVLWAFYAALFAAVWWKQGNGLLLSRGILPVPSAGIPSGWKNAEDWGTGALRRDRGGLSLPVWVWARTGGD